MCFLSEIFPSEVAFLSECCSFCVSGFLRNLLISFRNLLLSVRFPSKISFLSDFHQKSPFCQVSLRNFLSVRFPSESSFSLSEVRNILLYVRFSLNISFFSVRYFLLSVRFPSEILSVKNLLYVRFPSKISCFLRIKIKLFVSFTN